MQEEDTKPKGNFSNGHEAIKDVHQVPRFALYKPAFGISSLPVPQRGTDFLTSSDGPHAPKSESDGH